MIQYHQTVFVARQHVPKVWLNLLPMLSKYTTVASGLSEFAVQVYQVTRYQIPEDSNVHGYRSDNLRHDSYFSTTARPVTMTLIYCHLSGDVVKLRMLKPVQPVFGLRFESRTSRK
jgi:hypothetical protein